MDALAETNMECLRKYGNPSFEVALVHGGPGGAGQLAPLARKLSKTMGVLEPLQTAKSIEGQIHELHDALVSVSKNQITLIGHSWGAMLSILYTAEFPDFVKKLILVSCGPIDAKYTSAEVMKNRFARMSADQRAKFDDTFKKLGDPDCKDKNAVFTQLGRLVGKIDSYEPISDESVEARYDIFQGVWPEAESLRCRGGFIDAARKIRCPVLAIHGAFDPHPAGGIEGPLSSVIGDFRFILLEKCGHYPWIEHHAEDKFYSILRSELQKVEGPCLL